MWNWKENIFDHDHNNKYITTQEFNRLTAESFAVRLKQANLASKTDTDDKLKNLNKNVNSNKIKRVEAEENLFDLTNKVVQISEKGHYFLLDRL